MKRLRREGFVQLKTGIRKRYVWMCD